MSLPNDYHDSLKEIIDNGILNESPDNINYRLQLALQGAASKAANDLGAFDWLPQLITRVKTAVHKEICDDTKHAVNEKYQKLLSAGLTSDGVTAVATVIAPIVTAVAGPTFCIGTVVIYVSVFLIKIGLNVWCSYPPTPA